MPRLPARQAMSQPSGHRWEIRWTLIRLAGRNCRQLVQQPCTSWLQGKGGDGEVTLVPDPLGSCQFLELP